MSTPAASTTTGPMPTNRRSRWRPSAAAWMGPPSRPTPPPRPRSMRRKPGRHCAWSQVRRGAFRRWLPVTSIAAWCHLRCQTLLTLPSRSCPRIGRSHPHSATCRGLCAALRGPFSAVLTAAKASLLDHRAVEICVTQEAAAGCGTMASDIQGARHSGRSHLLEGRRACRLRGLCPVPPRPMLRRMTASLTRNRSRIARAVGWTCRQRRRSSGLRASDGVRRRRVGGRGTRHRG